MKIFDLFWRYGLAVVLGVFYQVFYWIFSPWTSYLVYWGLNLFYEITMNGNTFVINSSSFSLIPACTAATAYLLLAVLVLVTRGIKVMKRIKMFVYGSLIIFSFNLLRIYLLVWIYLRFGENYFEALHWVFWHFVSIIVVVLVWILMTKLYKVKWIPFYSDLRYLIKKIN